VKVFSEQELLGLDAPTLRDLLDLAEGGNVMERAAYLGLNPLVVPSHYVAVRAAVPELETGTQPFSPPIGAAQDGVRFNLTPDETEPDAPIDGQGDDAGDPLGLPEPDPAAAEDLAVMLAESAGTGRPFMAGTFALYSDPTGAVVIVTETEKSGVRRDVIPRKAVRFALSMMGGGGAKRGLLARMIRG
jgi:hypothetical protein